METEELYTLNMGDVEVYALYPWRRQSKRHPLPPRPPAGAEGATQTLLSRAPVPSPERGLGGGACRYGCSCGCYCLEMELESAEAAVEPKPILEQRLPPRAREGSPAPGKPGHPLGGPSTPQPQVLSQDRCAACDSRLRAKPRPLPPPLAGHNGQGDLPKQPCPPDKPTEQSLTKLPCPEDRSKTQC